MSTRIAHPSARVEKLQIRRVVSPLTQVALSLVGQNAHLVFVEAGRATTSQALEVNAETNKPRLIWLPVGGNHNLQVAGGGRASCVTIPQTALINALPATPLGDQMRRTLSQNLVFELEAGDGMKHAIDALDQEIVQRGPGADLAAEQYLTLLLLSVWRKARSDLKTHGRSPQGLSERFVALAAQNRRLHWTIGQYSEALDVSRDRLGTAVVRSTGLSPQGYLHRALIEDAQELLANTGMPIAQIAYRLGYSDPAYFSRFFTSQTGENPSVFRKTAKAKQPERVGSYAAWP